MKILNKYDPPHEKGVFGAIRKHDIHTGVDLYCEPGSEVFAIEDGVVISVQPFTGEAAGYPWWHETSAVLVEGTSGVICYGEIEPSVVKGNYVQTGSVIGKVKTVLKKDKGLPMTMLHIELYRNATNATVTWHLNEPQPDSLLDITPLLQRKGIL